MEVVFHAIERLGLPVVAAALLIWHVLSLNKKLTGNNDRMLAELGQFRELLQTAVKDKQDNERLLKQNESLVTLIKNSEKATMEMMRDLFLKKLSSSDESAGEKS